MAVVQAPRMDTPRTTPDVPPSPVFEDGLGQRWAGTSSTGEPLEILALRPEIAAASTFEFLLRERVSRLAGFRHSCYARIRDVERLTSGESTLAIVSDRVPGMRLSDLLAVAVPVLVVLVALVL